MLLRALVRYTLSRDTRFVVISGCGMTSRRSCLCHRECLAESFVLVGVTQKAWPMLRPPRSYSCLYFLDLEMLHQIHPDDSPNMAMSVLLHEEKFPTTSQSGPARNAFGERIISPPPEVKPQAPPSAFNLAPLTQTQCFRQLFPELPNQKALNHRIPRLPLRHPTTTIRLR